jgi:hypothetical protein
MNGPISAEHWRDYALVLLPVRKEFAARSLVFLALPGGAKFTNSEWK